MYKIDELGRIVIPKNVRKKLNLKKGESLDINLSGDTIIMKRFNNKCDCCGNKAIAEYKSRKFCKDCLKDLRGDINVDYF